ncbi:hypothetical protein WDU94_014215 [Cyamophila willieti]
MQGQTNNSTQINGKDFKMAQTDVPKWEQGLLLGPYNSLLNKMKRSVYNTICWNPVDSETDLIPHPRVNTDFLPNTDIVVEYFKKCGDFLKETQTRSKSGREKPAMLMRGDEATPKQRKRSAFSSKNTEARSSLGKDMDKFNKVLLETELGNQILDCKIENQNDVCGKWEKPRKECYNCHGLDKKRDEKRIEKGGEGEGETKMSYKQQDNMCGKNLNENTNHKHSSRIEKTNQYLCYNYRDKRKRCRQIYELSDELCRSFKEKGYVKVNVKVNPNVSVSDFDIVIRRDKVHPDQRRKDMDMIRGNIGH